jgi:hypothetical protein
MSVFGQINIYEQAVIRVVHYHQILDGAAGTSTVEVYRERGGVFTRICVVSLASGSGDFATGFAVPAGNLKVLEAGDYVYCQATSFQANGDGVTVDMHFTQNPLG